MTIWPLVSVVVLAIYLTGFAALVYCAWRAPAGYEDADGFRLGSKPVEPLAPPGKGDISGIKSSRRVGHAT